MTLGLIVSMFITFLLLPSLINVFAKENEIIGSVLKNVLSLDINTIKNTVFFVGIDNVELEELASSQLSGKKEFEHNYLFKDFFGDFQD